MNILALETSELSGSVAAWSSGKLIRELDLDQSQRSAQALAPAITALLEEVGWRPGDVQLTAVTVGPGSFTGLRVGVTTAKTFAYAAGTEVLGVNTLAVIADAAPDDVNDLIAVMDAQRGDISLSRFRRNATGVFEIVEPERLESIASWLAQLPNDAMIAGPILRKIREEIPVGTLIAPEKLWAPRARFVAQVAEREYAAGRRDDPFQLVPHYSRKPAAEEKLEKGKA